MAHFSRAGTILYLQGEHGKIFFKTQVLDKISHFMLAAGHFEFGLTWHELCLYGNQKTN